MVASKVAIIGCGVGGLTAIKSCLDAGLQPTCFEQQTWLGGIWNYTDHVRENLGSVHGNTITNVSKAMMCFSDFPFSKESPNYMHHSRFMKYLEMYAKEFDLHRYIQFSTKVERLSKTLDHKETGRWTVSYTRMKDDDDFDDNSEKIEETFDAVMVCPGHLWSQAWPKIPGMDKFKSIKIHSGDYRTFHPYVGKRVVVVGCSYSAGDIATELSQHASQVYLSTRRGGYIIKRLVPGKTKPFDHQFTRADEFLRSHFNVSLISGIVNKEYDFERLGLQPTGTLGVHQFRFINDYLPQKIITGCVIVKGELKELRETSVVVGGEVLENIDAVIFCTGFKLEFPFASEIIQVEDEHYARLYKHIFIPDADHQTLAVIGAPEIMGSSVPVVEMQARVCAEVFAGRCMLPNKDERLKKCVEWEQGLSEIGRRKEKYFYGLEYLPYMDELGEMIGTKPDLWSIFKKDPKLAYQCFFGPCVPAQYRLQGPNSNWEDARKVIMNTEEHFQWPLRARKDMPVITEKKSTYFYHVFVITMVIFIAFILSILI